MQSAPALFLDVWHPDLGGNHLYFGICKLYLENQASLVTSCQGGQGKTTENGEKL